MKFHEMPYQRPDPEVLKSRLTALTERLKTSDSYEAAKTVFLEMETLQKHIETMQTLSSIRHSIDTRDEFYDGEEKFWNAAGPELVQGLGEKVIMNAESQLVIRRVADLIFAKGDVSNG